MIQGKKTRGKQKIELRKIANEEDKLVTFSKRRTGITKKSSELVTLCGAEVGVLVFSPAGRPFTYGNPSFESVAARFLEQHRINNNNRNNNNNHNAINTTRSLLDAHRKQRIDQMNKLHNDMKEELEAELEKEQMLRQVLSGHRTEEWWWMKPVEELCKDEALKLLAFYKELNDTLCGKIQETLSNTMAAAYSQPLSQPSQTPAEGFPSYDGGGVGGFDGAGPSYYGGDN